MILAALQWVVAAAPSVWWMAAFVAVEVGIAVRAVAAVWGDR
jgi:hypothetical protein